MKTMHCMFWSASSFNATIGALPAWSPSRLDARRGHTRRQLGHVKGQGDDADVQRRGGLRGRHQSLGRTGPRGIISTRVEDSFQVSAVKHAGNFCLRSPIKKEHLPAFKVDID